MILEDFIDWKDKIFSEMEHIGAILSKQLSDEPRLLIREAENVEVWNARCVALLAQADSWLDRVKFELMPPKSEDRSEADRKAEIDSIVSPIRLIRDTLEGYADSIKQRLILVESILAFERQFIEPRIMENPLSTGKKQDHLKNLFNVQD